MKYDKWKAEQDKNRRRMEEEGNWFTIGEINLLVEEAKKIGFEPMPFLVTDKVFDGNKVTGTINFNHKKSDSMLIVERYDIRNLGLKIGVDNTADILFALLFQEIDNKAYVDNYSAI